MKDASCDAFWIPYKWWVLYSQGMFHSHASDERRNTVFSWMNCNIYYKDMSVWDDVNFYMCIHSCVARPSCNC